MNRKSLQQEKRHDRDEQQNNMSEHRLRKRPVICSVRSASVCLRGEHDDVRIYQGSEQRQKRVLIVELGCQQLHFVRQNDPETDEQTAANCDPDIHQECRQTVLNLRCFVGLDSLLRGIEQIRYRCSDTHGYDLERNALDDCCQRIAR
ncbi:hypothetical protein BH23CHL5_BH23CHL5_11290 [soil metagenome]